MNSKYIIGFIVVLLAIGGSIYFFGNQKSNDFTSTPAQNETSTDTTSESKTNPVTVIPQVVHNISISGFAFVPSTITVKKGETIVWTNKDGAPHTVTGGDLKSNSLGQNETYSFVYDRAGTFSYHCSIHPSMKGTVIVTD